AMLVVSGLLVAPTVGAQGPSPGSPPPLFPPTLLSSPVVPYPEGARGDATVILVVTVSADGTVRAAEPTETHEPFSSLAAKAALGWRFEPATRGDQRIASKIKIEVVFHAPSPPPAPATPESPPDAPVPTPAPPPAIEEVRVRGARAEASRTATLTRTEVRQIPGVFGDPFRAIEVMPGVTPIVSGLPFFFVRGAPPGNVGY